MQALDTQDKFQLSWDAEDSGRAVWYLQTLLYVRHQEDPTGAGEGAMRQARHMQRF